MTSLNQEQYISKRYKMLVKSGYDPETAYSRAAAEWLSGRTVNI